MKEAPTIPRISYDFYPYEKRSARRRRNRRKLQPNEQPACPAGDENVVHESEQGKKSQLTQELCNNTNILKDKNTGPGSDIVIPPCTIKTFTPWLVLMPKSVYSTTEEKLHDEILAFQNWAMPTPQEAEARRLTVDCVHMVMKSRLKDAQTQVYGSCAMSLALPTSDIDISLSTEEIWTEIDMKLVISQLAIQLRIVGLAPYILQIPSSKVPILKFTTLSECGSFGVDVCINNMTGLQAVDIVNDYLSKMPVLRPLVLLVKAILAKYGLNNPAASGLGSYAVMCMCIFFIKTNPSRRPSSFYDQPLVSGSLGTLLSDFLWYFSSKFPYSTSCISANDGCLYPNMKFEPGVEDDNLLRMNVQCLLDPELNVAKAVRKKTLQKIVDIFQKGFADIVQSSVHDKSILGHLLEIEEGVLNSRAQVHAVMENGTLNALSSRLRTSQSSQRSGKQYAVPLAQSTPKIGSNVSARVEAVLSKYQTLHSGDTQTNAPLNPEVART